MRAWLLLLAVLATFQTIVQVASTEDNLTISSRFIQAIQPIKKDIIIQINQPTPPLTKATTPPPPSKTTTTTTALMDFHGEQQDFIVYKPHKSDKSDNSETSSKLAATQEVQQEHNYFENQNFAKENNKNSVIIEIENIKEIETNDLNEIKAIEIKEKHNNYNNKQNKNRENLTEVKEEKNLKYKKNNYSNSNNNNKHKTTKMALSVKEDKQHNNNNKNVQQQQNQKINKQQIEEIEDSTTTAEATIQNSSSSQQQHHHQQQTQPASQHQHSHQHNHHHHRHHHHHHNTDSTSTSTSSSSFNPTSDNLSSTSVTSSSSTSSISIVTNTTPPPPPPPTTPLDDFDVLAEDDEPQVDAVIPEDGPRTYSNKEIIGDKVKPDPSTLVEIENSLLSLFNMKRPPKIDRSKIVIPEAMKQLYAQIMGHELNSVNIPKPGLLTKSANTVRSFTHQDSKIDDRFPHHHRFRLYFDIKSIPTEEKLKAAELQLTRDAISHASVNPRLSNRTRYQVLVYDITRVGVRGKREPSYLLLDNKTIRLNSTDTVSLDVQPAVDRWLASPKKNFGLLVEVRTSRSLKPAPHHHVRLRRSADEEHGLWQRKQPLLFTYTDDGRHKSRSIRDVSNRSKRAGRNPHPRPHRRKNSEAACSRHSLYVDFADVGWNDWIVAPPGYDAFYCHGKCPFPLAEHMNSTNHAVVQTIVNNINPGKVPKACCVPTQLEGISMLYLNDQSTVVLKNYQDMTVVGCGCR